MNFKPLLLPALLALAPACAFADNLPAIHWTGATSQITTFKTSNDVTITQLSAGSGPAASIVTDDFGGLTPGNNPAYLTSFLGADPTPGDIQMLTTTLGQTFRFDFATPFAPTDRLLLADVDAGEVYQIQAFIKNGAGYTQVSTGGWTLQACSGQTGTLPDASWPLWNSLAGTFTSGNANLNEPLDILTPDQPIDRIIAWQVSTNTPGSTTRIQFLSAPVGTSVPEPATLAPLAALTTLLALRRRRPQL